MAKQSPFRLGVYGGTFDPVHKGHVACAQRVLDAGLVDEIVMIPANIPSFKQDQKLASAEDRLTMAYLATENIPQLWVSAMEIQREGVSYTVDTLKQLQQEYPDAQLYFLLGADSASTLDTWYQAQELANLAIFVVLTRPGYQFENKLSEAFKVECLEAYTPDVSSTIIRETVKSGGDISQMVDQQVAEYINDHNLYR